MKVFTVIVSAVVCCAVLTSVCQADTLIYNNSTSSGYFWPTNSEYNEEFLDYGSSSGGLVSKFEIGYATSLSNPGTLYVRFWEGTSRWQRGNPIKTIAISDLDGSPNGYSYAFYKEYILPEEERFELPSGNFGYSYEFIWSYNESGPLLASGGLSNENYYWLYYINKWYGQEQIGGDYAGFYMKVYTGPALADITCDITGNKFDDADGDGVWDAGELGLGGWEMYVDTNGNDQFDLGVDPNVVTDPNGMYVFENLEFADPNDIKTFVVREVMQNGWTQTLPGGPDYEYTIIAEPNNIYGPYDFGNTDEVIPSADVAPDGGDGVVNLLDWTRFASAWQSQPGQPNWDPACNLVVTPPDIIGIDDLMVVFEQWLVHSPY
mgnify:CR=1 FL=1